MSQSIETPKQKRRLRRWDASTYLSEKHGLVYVPTTLAKMASVGGGPPMEYAGKIPLYPTDGLDQWAAAKIGPRVYSTAEQRALHAA